MDFITLEFALGRWSQSLYRWAITIIPLFVLLYVIRPKFLQKYRIQQIAEHKPKYLTEFMRSVLIFLVYTIPTYVLMTVKNYTGYSTTASATLRPIHFSSSGNWPKTIESIFKPKPSFGLMPVKLSSRI